jgi:pimeloyl-ACP methyl ester carboxylesterase
MTPIRTNTPPEEGPGDSAQFYVDFPSFKELEKRYAVAYWDQRGSGTSQGSPPLDSTNSLFLDECRRDTTPRAD